MMNRDLQVTVWFYKVAPPLYSLFNCVVFICGVVFYGVDLIFRVVLNLGSSSVLRPFSFWRLSLLTPHPNLSPLFGYNYWFSFGICLKTNQQNNPDTESIMVIRLALKKLSPSHTKLYDHWNSLINLLMAGNIVEEDAHF